MEILDHTPAAEWPRLHYRFVGTQMVGYRSGLTPQETTGMEAREVPHSYDFKPVLAAYADVAMTARPILLKADYETYDSMGNHERLVLPLTDVAGAVRQLAVCLERLDERSTEFGA